MGPSWLRIAAVAAVAAGLATAFAHAEAPSDGWLKARQVKFAAFRAAHPDPDGEIARLKAATAALVAAAPPFQTAADDASLDRPPVIWRASKAPVELWDGPEYPKMFALPAGEYSMGSPAAEKGHLPMEGPRHRVRIDHNVAVSQSAVTVGEYAAFVADTHHDIGEACFTIEGDDYRLRGNRDFRHVGFNQTDDGPVLCVNWFDAMAYVNWLSKKTGHAYRLLSEAEYEYANRSGSAAPYWWGDEIGKNRANCIGCGSAFDNKVLAPVGSFPANPFGLYDTAGNNLSWLADCWNATYAGAPVDGSAFNTGDCDLHILRGGSLHSVPAGLRSAARSRHWFSLRNVTVSFRVARTL